MEWGGEGEGRGAICNAMSAVDGADGRATAVVDDGNDEGTTTTTTTTCPICLDPMSHGDALHPVLCSTPECHYNFCQNCLLALYDSSLDDYGMASDGNRHVKVRLACPNCRSDISSTIRDTMDRRESELSMALMDVPDGELSAGELRLKHQDRLRRSAGGGNERGRQRRRRVLDVDPTLFGGLEIAMSESERRYVTGLMTSGDPDMLCTAATILSGVATLLRDGGAIGGGGGPSGPRAALARASSTGDDDGGNIDGDKHANTDDKRVPSG